MVLWGTRFRPGFCEGMIRKRQDSQESRLREKCPCVERYSLSELAEAGLPLQSTARTGILTCGHAFGAERMYR